MHVVQRGHNRAPCFFEDADRRLYLGLLGQFAREYACRIHAFALMNNHVHLLVTPLWTLGLARMMKQVNQRYVQSVNRRLGRTGTLCQGRFHSCLVDSS